MFTSNMNDRCRERLKKQKEEETDLAYLAENEKSVKQLWEQYSVCIYIQSDELEPVRGKLPIR